MHLWVFCIEHLSLQPIVEAIIFDAFHENFLWFLVVVIVLMKRIGCLISHSGIEKKSSVTHLLICETATPCILYLLQQSLFPIVLHRRKNHDGCLLLLLFFCCAESFFIGLQSVYDLFFLIFRRICIASYCVGSFLPDSP